MKTTVVLTVLAILAQLSLGQSTQPASNQGRVPDAAAGVKLGEKVLTNVYGKKTIQAEKPFEASLSGGIWQVRGTLYCGKDRSLKGIQCLGGVAMVDIRQSDGHVLKTGHGK